MSRSLCDAAKAAAVPSRHLRSLLLFSAESDQRDFPFIWSRRVGGGGGDGSGEQGGGGGRGRGEGRRRRRGRGRRGHLLTGPDLSALSTLIQPNNSCCDTFPNYPKHNDRPLPNPTRSVSLAKATSKPAAWTPRTGRKTKCREGSPICQHMNLSFILTARLAKHKLQASFSRKMSS